MWWCWHKFLDKSDKILSSKFYFSSVCIFILLRQPNTTSHTILTSAPYFVFPGLYVLNFRRPHHGIVASSSDSSLGCKLTWISVENFTQRPYSEYPPCIVCFLVCFVIWATQFTTFIFLLYLPLALVKTMGQIEITYMEELWGRECHCPKFQLHHHQTPQYVSAHNSHTIS